MRLRGLFLAACCGALIGAVAATVNWIQSIVSNAYLEYGMLRLSYRALVGMWNTSMLGSVVTAAVLYTLSIILLRKARWSVRRVSRFAVLAGAVIIVLFAVNWGLRIRTGFTLGLAARRIAAKIAGLATGSLSLTQLRPTLAANQEGAVLLACGLAAAILIFWLLLKAPWERPLARVAANSRHFERAGLVLAALTLSLNIMSAYDVWRSSPAGPNILMIVIDCLRPDHVGHYGYTRDTTPNIDEMARGGTVFLDAYTNAPWTKPSIGTLFTSLYPDVHTAVSCLDILPERALTVAEVLGNEGYFTVFLNSENPFITGRFGFHQGFDVAEDSGTHCDAAELTDRFLSLLADRGGKRFFAYLHYMDAHVPYAHNALSAGFADPDYRGEFQLDSLSVKLVRKRTAEGRINEKDKAYIRGLYDGQIKYVDEHVGRILDGLKREGLQDRTLIILFADHGEEFWEHGNFEHGHTVYQELIRIPLILSGCGLHAASVKRRISLIDILPTVLELAAIHSGHTSLQGASIGPSVRGEPGQDREMPVYAGGSLYGREKRCVIRGDNKLIVNTPHDAYKLEFMGPRSTSPFEVYDLRHDPREKTDLSEAEAPVAIELRNLMREFEEVRSVTKGKRTIMDEDLERKLRSVGYL